MPSLHPHHPDLPQRHTAQAEDGFGISLAERLQPPQVGIEAGCEVARFQPAVEVARIRIQRMFFSLLRTRRRERGPERLKRPRLDGEPAGGGMAAEADKMFRRSRERVMDVVPVRRTHAPRLADRHGGRHVVVFQQTRGDNARNPEMPPLPLGRSRHASRIPGDDGL